MSNKTSTAIIGAGMGGLAAASTPRQARREANVYEQTAEFICVGAGTAGVVPRERIHLNKKSIGIDNRASGVRLSFADGSDVTADAVVVADGIHSLVRETIVGHVTPVRNGHIAYRAVFSSHLADRDLGNSRTMRWSEDRQIVTYYTTRRKSDIYFVTSLPEPADSMANGSWSAKGDVRELRQAYEEFHPDVCAMLAACPDCHKWATQEPEPLSRWSDGRVVLLGDACHPDAAADGAGSRHVDRGCSDPRPLPCQQRCRRSRGRVRALRGASQTAYLARPGGLEQRRRAPRRCQLALRLWPLGHPVGHSFGSTGIGSCGLMVAAVYARGRASRPNNGRARISTTLLGARARRRRQRVNASTAAPLQLSTQREEPHEAGI